MILRYLLVVLPLLALEIKSDPVDRRRAFVPVRPPPAVEVPAIEPVGVSNVPRPAPAPAVETVPEPAARPPTGGTTNPDHPVEVPSDISGSGSGDPQPQQEPQGQSPSPNSSPKQPTQPKQPNSHPPTPDEEVFVLPPIPKDNEDLQEQAPLYDLGSYTANQEVLFGNFKGPQDVLMSKVFDFFTAETSYISGDAYVSATGSQQPFQSGAKPTGQNLRFTQPVRQVQQDVGGGPSSIVTTFNPAAPKDVCGVWTSLARYCSGGGAQCACSSSSYYVPDLWNSLAAKCASLTTECTASVTINANANYWCQLGRVASNAKGFCPTTGLASGVTPVKFAATAGMPRSIAATATPTPTGIVNYINSAIAGTSANSVPGATTSPNTLSASNQQSSSASVSHALWRELLATGLIMGTLFASMAYI